MDNQRVTEFLKRWAELYKSNPNVVFNPNQVYKELVRIGVPEQERYVDLRHVPSKYYPDVKANPSQISPICHPQSPFNNWIQIFSFAPNTDCFVQSNWAYFCQFVSRDNKARCAGEHIKMYIPLDEAHIEQGAKQIFTFLDENRISHSSKIGSHIRFDNIVVRLIDPKDAERLLTFIKNNPFIQEGLLPANPFAFQQDGIAMACDGRKSYNETTSVLIKMYLDACRQQNRLDQVSAQDYQNFIRTKYKEQFLVHSNNDLMNNLDWEDETDERNYREIIALMIQTAHPQFDFSDYLKHYAQCSNIELLDERQVMIVNRLLAEALEAMTARWQSAEEGYKNVKDFYHGGQPNLITRTNDLRKRMVNGPFRETLKRILQMKGMSYDEYAHMIIEQYHLDLEEIARRSMSK